MKKEQVLSAFNSAINFLENKGMTEDFIEFSAKSDRDDIRKFIETGKLEQDVSVNKPEQKARKCRECAHLKDYGSEGSMACELGAERFRKGMGFCNRFKKQG